MPSSAELRHALTPLSLWLRHAEDGMLIGVKGQGASMARQVALQRLKIRESALRWDKTKSHQAAGGVIDKDDQRASWTTILKPTVLTAVNLNQLAEMLATDARLMKPAPLFARQPEAFLAHPLAKRLPGNAQAVALQ